MTSLIAGVLMGAGTGGVLLGHVEIGGTLIFLGFAIWTSEFKR